MITLSINKLFMCIYLFKQTLKYHIYEKEKLKFRKDSKMMISHIILKVNYHLL